MCGDGGIGKNLDFAVMLSTAQSQVLPDLWGVLLLAHPTEQRPRERPSVFDEPGTRQCAQVCMFPEGHPPVEGEPPSGVQAASLGGAPACTGLRVRGGGRGGGSPWFPGVSFS